MLNVVTETVNPPPVCCLVNQITTLIYLERQNQIKCMSVAFIRCQISVFVSSLARSIIVNIWLTLCVLLVDGVEPDDITDQQEQIDKSS